MGKFLVLFTMACCISITTDRTFALDFLQGIQDVGKAVGGYVGNFASGFQESFNDPTPLKDRQDIFSRSAAAVAEATGAAAKGLLDFAVKLNFLSYLTLEEYNKQYNGFEGEKLKIHKSNAEFYRPKSDAPLPESIDWAQLGAVTSVKNQSGCSGCWAFAASGAMEGQLFKKTGKLIDVSVQNLLDCATGKKYVNQGCKGGLVHTAFTYVQDRGGLNSEHSYPYVSTRGDGICRFDEDNVVVKCKEYNQIPVGDEETLARAVATEGPVAAAIDASGELFRVYHDGVYHNPNCSSQPERLSHAVLIVGYGIENGKKYWLVKNSYSTAWGINGFLKLRKDADNHCGIATEAYIPFLE